MDAYSRWAGVSLIGVSLILKETIQITAAIEAAKINNFFIVFKFRLSIIKKGPKA